MRKIQKKAQTTLEFTLCFVVLILLFIAAFKIFIWSGQTLVGRQSAFEANETAQDPVVDFYTPEPLNLSVTITPRPSGGTPTPVPTPTPVQGAWIEQPGTSVATTCQGYALRPPQGTCTVGDAATYCEPYTILNLDNGGILHYYLCEAE